MTKRLKWSAWILLVMLALLAVGWAYGAITDWPAIADRPVRLAYIIGDFGLVIPLGVAGGVGLLKNARWAGSVFTLAVGALLFDVAHGVFYLIWDNYFGIPLAVAVLLLAVLMGYVVFAMYALAERDRAS